MVTPEDNLSKCMFIKVVNFFWRKQGRLSHNQSQCIYISNWPLKVRIQLNKVTTLFWWYKNIDVQGLQSLQWELRTYHPHWLFHAGPEDPTNYPKSRESHWTKKSTSRSGWCRKEGRPYHQVPLNKVDENH